MTSWKVASVRALGKLALPLGSIFCYQEIMSTSISDNKKPRGRPATTGTGTFVGVRVHEPMLSQIDKWAKKNGSLSRPEAVRQMIAAYLADQ